jgi:hypothetical protein
MHFVLARLVLPLLALDTNDLELATTTIACIVVSMSSEKAIPISIESLVVVVVAVIGAVVVPVFVVDVVVVVVVVSFGTGIAAHTEVGVDMLGIVEQGAATVVGMARPCSTNRACSWM